MLKLLGIAISALPFLTGIAGTCLSDLDCSLNGQCRSSNKCYCEPGWNGDSCNVLNFMPVEFPQGYGMSPTNQTTWGGSMLYDEKENLYHIYVAVMMNKCSLQDWGKVSRVEHATSTKPTGPFLFSDVTLGAWSHNPHIVKLKDGTFALFHIGNADADQSKISNCSQSASLPHFEMSQVGSQTIHISKTYEGPFQPVVNNSLPSCNNPAPFVHNNGTIFVVCNSFELYRSENIEGPWLFVVKITIDPSRGLLTGNFEDCLFYLDNKGHYHIFHHVYRYDESHTECIDSTVSSHSYSLDGYTWFSTAQQPYTTQIPMTNGEKITVSTRERPKILFNKEGLPTHLVNGVSSALACPEVTTGCVDCKYKNWDYTLISPINLNIHGFNDIKLVSPVEKIIN